MTAGATPKGSITVSRARRGHGQLAESVQASLARGRSAAATCHWRETRASIRRSYAQIPPNFISARTSQWQESFLRLISCNNFASSATQIHVKNGPQTFAHWPPRLQS